MKTIGIGLLWVGFLVGSLATVINVGPKGVEFTKQLTPNSAAKGRFSFQDLSAVTVPEDGWHLIPWHWYIPAAVVCLAGVVLIQVKNRSSVNQTAATAASLTDLLATLQNLKKNAGELSSRATSQAPSKTVEAIDSNIVDDLRTFADGRETIIAEHGLELFADVMTNFAAGERAINRAWSAASDGYIDEAADCINRAASLFHEAVEILSRVTK